MYRMANWPEQQKEVTGELIRGFQHALQIPRYKQTIEWTKEQIMSLKDMLMGTPSSVEWLTEEQMKELMAKLGRMYEELFDPEHAYTYDEYGEFFLALMMNAVHEANMLASDIDFSEPCLNPIDYPSVFHSLLEDIKEEQKEILENTDKQFVRMTEDEMRKEAHRRILSMFCFPHMADDTFIIESYSPVFWDMDFTFFFDHSLDDFTRTAESEIGSYLGLVSSEEDREPVSGSIREPIKEKQMHRVSMEEKEEES